MNDAPATKKTTLKPFGRDEAQKLRLKEEALRTMSRQECFDRGFLGVKDLDDEELVKGRCRDENGRIPRRNGKTDLIPAERYDEMVAEHEARYKQRLREYLNMALDTVVDIMQDDTVEPREKLEAAKWITERAAGKSVEHIAHTVEMKPWEGLLTDVTGIGSISREEHRRLSAQGPGSGIIDVEIVDDDAVQQPDVQDAGESAPGTDVVPVHQPRPDEQREDIQQETFVQQEPDAVKFVDGERSFQHDPTTQAPDRPVVDEIPDVYEAYGSRRTEAKGYADQVRAAEDLARRRKEARERVQNAKKARAIKRATGGDAIEDEITGATVDDDGNVTFE